MITADEARRFSAPQLKTDLIYIEQEIVDAASTFARSARVEFTSSERFFDEGRPSQYREEVLAALREQGFNAEFGYAYRDGTPELLIQW